MGLRYNLRQAIYRALLDVLVDRDGNTILDRDGNAVTPRNLIGATGIYDTPPRADNAGNKGSRFPYITFGATVVSEFDTNTRVGFDVLMRLHFHSRSGSQKEIEDMQDAVLTRLHLQTLTVDDHHSILLRREQSDIAPGPEGLHQGTDEYRVYIEQL
jgi:hypothetical protein